jgi:hypothetical protein
VIALLRRLSEPIKCENISARIFRASVSLPTRGHFYTIHCTEVLTMTKILCSFFIIYSPFSSSFFTGKECSLCNLKMH